LFIYIRLCQSTDECEELLSDGVDNEVDMLLKFRLVGLYPSGKISKTGRFCSKVFSMLIFYFISDPSVMSSMSFSNSKAIFRSTSFSIREMLDNKRPIMAIATCLYAPVAMAKVTEICFGFWKHHE
jgi:hypothetical protein